MDKHNEEDLKKLSMDFLICCYFGQSKDLLKAAIDRAYLDMARTLKFKDITEKDKFKTRYDASELISEKIKEFNKPFNTWHGETIVELKKRYEPIMSDRMTDGQAQKWLNMTIKYLFVFKSLLGIDDSRFDDFRVFLTSTSISDYKVPIDSYVLKGSGLSELQSMKWSKLDEESKQKYSVADDKLKNNNMGFLWELENWEKFSAEYSQKDKNSYAQYYDERKTKKEVVNDHD